MWTLPSAVTVHGVVLGTVSPVKTSTLNRGVKYFDGTFSDGKKTLRMVSFEPKLRGQLEGICENKYVVLLCEEKQDR